MFNAEKVKDDNEKEYTELFHDGKTVKNIKDHIKMGKLMELV